MPTSDRPRTEILAKHDATRQCKAALAAFFTSYAKEYRKGTALGEERPYTV